jgi:CBS domain-containing protein
MVLQVSPLPVFAVEQSGRFLGVVLAEELLEAARQRGAFGFVSALVHRDVPIVQASDSLDAARSKLQRSPVRAAAVVRQGAFLGLVTEGELARAMDVSDRLQSGRPRSGWLERVDRR